MGLSGDSQLLFTLPIVPPTDGRVQEEDFVSNMYNRTLLDNFEVVDIQELLDEALRFTQQCSMDEDVNKAIMTRLILRQRLLDAVELISAPIKRPKCDAGSIVRSCSLNYLRRIESKLQCTKLLVSKFNMH